MAFAQETFAGLSLGSILVLLALGLSIIFGLMDVINMAHGEFMMIGAFTTFVVSEIFKTLPPALYDYYPIIAIPAAFFVAGLIGYLCEGLIIKHLYGRPLETLLATFGLSVILIQIARVKFGDSLSVKPPSWMEGAGKCMPDLVPGSQPAVHHYLLRDLHRPGVPPRESHQDGASASGNDAESADGRCLGVPTRRMDGMTFAFGCGLAGLAGVAVPLYNKINPSIGQEYIVDSFMVVVVGGVGTLAGAIWAGMGLGFLSKFIEPFLAQFPTFASSSSVIGKVLVLAAIVVFLTTAATGFVPAKGEVGRCLATTPPRTAKRNWFLIRQRGRRDPRRGSSSSDRACSSPDCPTRRITKLRIATVGGVLLLGFVLIPLLNVAGVVPDYKVNLLGKYLCFAIAALGIDLIWGYTGLLSLCQALFFCLGGYAMAMHLSLPQGWGDVRPEYNNIPQFMSFNNLTQLPGFLDTVPVIPHVLCIGVLLPGCWPLLRIRHSPKSGQAVFISRS